MIDTKLDAIVKRKIIHYLGDNDEDLAMFVNEHLKDHKGPGKLVEGLEPVRSNSLTLCPTKQVYLAGSRHGRDRIRDCALEADYI